MAQSLAVGDEAPNFDLTSTEDVVLMLRDECVRTGVVLYLFHDTEGDRVRDDLLALARRWDELSAADSRVLGVSRAKLPELKQLQKELQEMQHVLSKDAMQKRQFDLVELKGQLENESAGLEQQLKLDEARLTSPLREKFVEVVDEIGRNEGFSLILLRGAPGIMYSREALDITDLVIKTFNSKS